MSTEDYDQIRELLGQCGYSSSVELAYALKQDKYVVLLESVARDRLSPGGLDDQLAELVGKPVTIKFAEV